MWLRRSRFTFCDQEGEGPRKRLPRHAISSRSASFALPFFYDADALSHRLWKSVAESACVQGNEQATTATSIPSFHHIQTLDRPPADLPSPPISNRKDLGRPRRQDLRQDRIDGLKVPHTAMPPSLHMRRDLAEVQNSFSSWDSCMSQTYCKWPAIVGIIIGSLIVISIIWCCARCLCCGAECCCACCSCFNRCCPSPRRKNEGYQQPPAQPYGGYGGYGGQYQSPAPPMYGAGAQQWGGYRGPQTATYDTGSKQGNAGYNEDSLPAMPSWANAKERHELVEDEDVEMKKMDQQAAQSQPFLASGAQQPYDQHASNGRYYDAQDAPPAADLGTMQTGPYHNYDQHQQFVTSPVSTAGQQSTYPPTYRTYASPPSTVYEPSIPPSYHTAAPTSPPPGLVPGGGIGRKPVQGTYRDV